MSELISIITPTFNNERHIEETISSVKAQTYPNWEMNIVDDCSSDKTREIVSRLAKTDSRIHLFCQEKNAGAAAARNRSLEYAKGRYIAYLDADDIWLPDKLKKQIQFMVQKECGFSCVSYEVIDEKGNPLGKTVRQLDSVDYKGFLTNNYLQTVGIMVDLKYVDKELLVMPGMKRRQDAATWLQILKANNKCYGMKETLAQYRRVGDSLSSNKVRAVKGMWSLYRDVECLSLPFSFYCFVRYAFLAVWKRIYIRNRTDAY